jgi:hypothetical protein
MPGGTSTPSVTEKKTFVEIRLCIPQQLLAPSASFTSAAVRDERRHGLALQLANSSIRQNRVRIGDHLPASAKAR